MADEPTQAAGVPVVIALAFKDDQQDTDRIGRVEYHPRHIARRMVDSGEARWLDDPRNADDRWPIQDDDEQDTDLPASAGPASVTEPKPLSAMSKTELRAVIPGGTDLPDTTTRNELLAFARNAQQPGSEPEPVPAEPAADTNADQPTQ